MTSAASLDWTPSFVYSHDGTSFTRTMGEVRTLLVEITQVRLSSLVTPGTTLPLSSDVSLTVEEIRDSRRCKVVGPRIPIHQYRYPDDAVWTPCNPPTEAE